MCARVGGFIQARKTLWTETPFSSKDLHLHSADGTVKIVEDGGNMFRHMLLPVIHTSLCPGPENCSLHVMTPRTSNFRLTTRCQMLLLYALSSSSPVNVHSFMELVMTCDWRPHRTPKSVFLIINPYFNKKCTH